jgi:2'-5' RNA ligase
MESTRLFIAAPLPLPVKTALVSAQARLRRVGAPVRWVAAEAMHLTLHFLGETDTALVPAIEAVMQQICMNHSALQLCLTTTGAFPNSRRPNVLWAGIGGDTDALGQIAATLQNALAQIGLAEDMRPFRPHLTLGRTRRDAPPQMIERLGDTIRALPQLTPATWECERIVLFRSELRREGPHYTALAECSLLPARTR